MQMALYTVEDFFSEQIGKSIQTRALTKREGDSAPLSFLQNNIIEPFLHWAAFSADKAGLRIATASTGHSLAQKPHPIQALSFLRNGNSC
jgi:hypothetical protein